MKKLLPLLLLSLCVFTAVATGVDDRGAHNDPAVNERANACYDGGTMAGKCETHWAWTCGWYLIRYQYGVIARGQFPSGCMPLLGEESPKVISTPPPFPSLTGCIPFGISNVHFRFTGGYTQGTPSGDLYDVYNSDCTTVINTLYGRYVYAPAPYDSQFLCQTAFGMNAILYVANDFWACS